MTRRKKNEIHTNIIPFENKDSIRCKRLRTKRHKKPISVYDCEFERESQRNLGFINAMKWYENLDFSEAEVDAEMKTINKSLWLYFDFKPLENCEETKHKCISTTNKRFGYGKSLKCSTYCKM